jgi:hypothetical protein
MVGGGRGTPGALAEARHAHAQARALRAAMAPGGSGAWAAPMRARPGAPWQPRSLVRV